MQVPVQGTVLVLASTFPAREDDPVPAFVRDQVIAMARQRKDLRFHVLAPHDSRSDTRDHVRHQWYDEHRFHYVLPRRMERLAGRGIMPFLQSNPFGIVLVPFLLAASLVSTVRLARRLRPHFLYAHWFTPQGIVASLASLLTGIPWFLTTHASDVAVWNRIPGGSGVVGRALRNCRGITAVSTRTRERLASSLSRKDRRRIMARTTNLPMGVPLSPGIHAECKSGPISEFLFIGRLVEKKGVHLLLPAFASLASRHGNVRLTIAGDGPMRLSLETMARSMGLNMDRVRFSGYVHGAGKEMLFQEVHALVVPSIITGTGDAEGLPVALLEGLSHGLPVLATKDSGADDIIHDGVEGFLADGTDAASLEKGLERILGLDPMTREIMGQNARALAGSFSWDRIARKHLELFRKLSLLPS